MERAANGSDLDLEQEFKDAAMKLLRELKEKHFEGTGTLLKKVPTSAKRAREDQCPRGPVASVRRTSCGRRRATGDVSKRRRSHKEDSQDDFVEVVKSRRGPSRARGSAGVSRCSATGRKKVPERNGAGRGRREPFSSRGPRDNMRGTGAKRAARDTEQRRGSKPAKRSSRT